MAAEGSWQRFFEDEPAPGDLDEQTQNLEAFVNSHIAAKRRIVLITSGGTTVPLEKNMVRFLDNFSAGSRGSASAEQFLAQGYAVVFLHRRFSLAPFERHMPPTLLLPALRLDHSDEGIMVADDVAARLRPVLQAWRKAAHGTGEGGDTPTLLTVPFVTVTDYLFLLRASCCALARAGPSALIYLAAAVSDFYIPNSETATHKIQSRSGPLQLSMTPVPKMLGAVVSSWCPRAFVVSFKLETNPELLGPKARRALEMYGHQLVVANLLHTRKQTVTFVTAVPDAEDQVISLTPEQLQDGTEIEQQIIANILERHTPFCTQ